MANRGLMSGANSACVPYCAVYLIIFHVVCEPEIRDCGAVSSHSLLISNRQHQVTCTLVIRHAVVSMLDVAGRRR